MHKTLLRTKISGTLLLLVLLVASWFFLIRPQMSSPEKVAQQQLQAENEYQQTQQKLLTLQKAKKNVKGWQKKANKLSTKFPSTVDPANISASVYAAAKRAGIPANKITNIAVGVAVPFDPANPTAGSTGAPTSPPASVPPTPAPSGGTGGGASPQAMKLPVTITITGTVRDAGNLAQKMVTSPKYFAVNSILTAGQTVTLDTYTLLLPPLPKAPAQ